MANDLI